MLSAGSRSRGDFAVLSEVCEVLMLE